MENYMKLEIAAIGENESFARSAVAAFALTLNPSLSELSDIKTAVSEAVTNCIVHAYAGESAENKILIECYTQKHTLDNGQTQGELHIQITDFGKGIADVEAARSPFFTTLDDEERSGMGFTVMQTFTDRMEVRSEVGKGTCVWMEKIFDDEE